jgi:hypothetical protein
MEVPVIDAAASEPSKTTAHNILDSSESAKLDFGQYLISKSFAFKVRSRHRGLDEGGSNAVDLDAMRRELDSHGLHQSLDCVLGRAIESSRCHCDATPRTAPASVALVSTDRPGFSILIMQFPSVCVHCRRSAIHPSGLQWCRKARSAYSTS